MAKDLISKKNLVEDLLDTEANGFEEIIIPMVFDKYKEEVYIAEDGEAYPDDVITEEKFHDAMIEFLTKYVVNFIKTAKD